MTTCVVAYVICQVPRSKMIGYFSQQELEALQSRCRAASRVLQDRQRSCNTLTRICTHILWVSGLMGCNCADPLSLGITFIRRR